jgi:hypothetical protein
MEWPISNAEFNARFPESTRYAEWRDSGFVYWYFRDAQNIIGRACYKISDTTIAFDVLDSCQSSLLIDHYEAKKARENNDAELLKELMAVVTENEERIRAFDRIVRELSRKLSDSGRRTFMAS